MNAYANAVQKLNAITCIQIDAGKSAEDVFNDIKRVFSLHGVKVKNLFITYVSINQHFQHMQKWIFIVEIMLYDLQ